MANNKEFKAGVYAVIAGVAVAVVLVVITIFAFTTRYTAFSPTKVAQAYVDTIVQTGDGYNAYKNTLVSKNQKFGDFIRNAYMSPYVNEDAEKADFVGTGNEKETAAINEVYNTMYDYYVELLNTYGLDDYDAVFSNYFAKLAEVRKAVYNDDYMDTEFMFGAFESNVSSYGASLTGTDRSIASDGKTILQEATVGKYQERFGIETEVEAENVVDGKKVNVKENKLVYRLTTTVKDTVALSEDEVKAYVAEYAQRAEVLAKSGEAKANEYGLEDDEKNTPKSNMISAFEKLDLSADITDVNKCIVEVALDDGKVVATQEVYVVQIGNSWYVDETNVDTSALYLDNVIELP